MAAQSRLKPILEKYVNDEANDSIGNRILAQKILKENPDLDYDVQTVRVSLYKLRKKKVSQDAQVDVSLENDTKWEVSDGHYHWKSARGHVKLPVSFIDTLFYEYSEHGLNLSQTEIINKYDLKVWQWHSIKRTLQLYKKSHIFSPYTVENTPPEELATMVEEKIGRVFTSVGLQVEAKYNKKLRQEYKKAIYKQTEKDLFLQTFLLELQDLFIHNKVKVQPTIRVMAEPEDRVVNVFIFDVHFGAESRSELLPPYSPQITKEMFDRIAQEVNALNPKEVHLWFGGDNIETFTGLNHPDSWRGIAKGYYGAEVIKRAFTAYVEFISSVNNVKKIYAVPGNHDRATESKAVDSHGWMAEILFEMINLSFQQKIPVQYCEKIASASVDGIHYLMSHGDKKLTNITPSELILRYGDPYKFNLLISGHYHTRKILKDQENFRQVVAPSLFTGNDYSVDLGYTSGAGYLLVMNNGFNKPKVIDNCL